MGSIYRFYKGFSTFCQIELYVQDCIKINIQVLK